MSFRFKKGCRSCAIIREEGGADHRHSKLFQLVNQWHTRQLDLTVVHEGYKDRMTYLALRRHALKHQHINDQQLRDTKAKQVKAELQTDTSIALKHHTDRREKLLTWLEEEMKDGNVKPTLTGMVQLLKQDMDIEEKQKDRSIEVFKMMAKFQSGEVVNSGQDTTRRITDSTN